MNEYILDVDNRLNIKQALLFLIFFRKTHSRLKTQDSRLEIKKERFF